MRAGAVLLLTVGAVLVAGSAEAAAPKDPKEPQHRHVAADTRTAKSIALKRSDLASGWKAAPKQPRGRPCKSEPDESKLVQTARIDPTFVWRDGVTTVGSEVDTFKTAAQAKRDWTLSTIALIRSCLLQSARDQLATQHVTVRVSSARSIKGPKLGERSLHDRLVFELRRTVSGKTQTQRLVYELVGFNIGRTSVVLHALSSFAQPLPASGLDALAKALARRLVSASGGI